MGAAGVKIPALLNSRSIRPCVSATRAKSRSTEARSVTSVTTGSDAAIWLAAASRVSRRRPASTTA